MHPTLAPYDRAQSRRTFLLIAVICFFFFGAWAWIFLSQKPRVADGEITSVTAVPFHTEFSQGGKPSEGGYGGGLQKYDEMYVWVAMRIKSLNPQVPLFETGQKATVVLPNGEEKYAYAASLSEIAQVRKLPGIGKIPAEILARDLTLQPGQEAQGFALFAFPLTPDEWKSRHEFSVSVSWQYQRALALREQRGLR